MDRTHDQLWQAYIDGELSVAEAATFEASLSEAARAQLAAEMHFERSLAERLARDAACPEDVWARTRARLDGPGAAVPAHRFTPRRIVWGTAATLAAAAIALAITLSLPRGERMDESFVVDAASLDDLADTADVLGGPAEVESFLRDGGIPIAVHDLSVLDKRTRLFHYDVHFIGARWAELKGVADRVPVAEVLMGCCNQPVKIVLARQGTPEARSLARALGDPDLHVQASRKVGEYVAGVVAEHRASDMLDILDRSQ